MTDAALLEAAQAAFDHVPVFRRLWHRRPATTTDIPFTDIAAFHAVSGPGELITAGAEPVGVVPPFCRGRPHLPVTRLEAEGDWLLRQARLLHGLAMVSGTRLPGRVALLTDDTTGPFAADLVELLAWSRIQASLVYAGAPLRRMAATLRALAADLLLIVAPGLTAEAEGRLASMLHSAAPIRPPSTGARLLVCDELGVVAAAAVGSDTYAPVDASVRLENDPETGRLAVTSLRFAAAPVIRLRIGRAIPLAAVPEGE